MTCQPIHEARDETKLGALKADMLANGWVGAPLVADGDQLLTGAHRYAAAAAINEAAETDWDLPRIDIPVTDVRDLFAEAGLDFDAAYAEVEAYYGDWFDAMVETMRSLPDGVRAEYGIDLH